MFFVIDNGHTQTRGDEMINDTKGINVGDVVYAVDVVSEWPSFRKILVSKVTPRTLLGKDCGYSNSIFELTFKVSQYGFSKSFHEARSFWIDNLLKKQIEVLKNQQAHYENKIENLLNSDDL